MRLILLFSLSLFLPFSLTAQIAWTWQELDSMPARVANNAVAFGTDGTNNYVYSFGGIDSTKNFDGINKRAFRYTIETNNWEEITPLPFTITNIASGASTVNNIIYIIGGYHVFSSGGEASTDEVIRYDPTTNTYLPNGTSIPLRIDDHVQAVWRDSLIYVVTGWSNTGNVPDVQIYDPALDDWLVGNPTPNTNDYKAFGASGEIIGDTIYYYGGASAGSSFPAKKILRKGTINPANPIEIDWTLEEDGPNTLYRSAALKHGNNVFWAGGSATSYNYDGIAYNGSGGVSPLTQIMRYDALNKNWYTGEGAPYGVMDLRGIAQISPTKWIICGGMESDQYVSQRTFLLTYDPITGSIPKQEATNQELKILGNQIILETVPNSIHIVGLDGKTITDLPVENPRIPQSLNGLYIIQAKYDQKILTRKIIR